MLAEIRGEGLVELLRMGPAKVDDFGAHEHAVPDPFLFHPLGGYPDEIG